MELLFRTNALRSQNVKENVIPVNRRNLSSLICGTPHNVLDVLGCPWMSLDRSSQPETIFGFNTAIAPWMSIESTASISTVLWSGVGSFLCSILLPNDQVQLRRGFAERLRQTNPPFASWWYSYSPLTRRTIPLYASPIVSQRKSISACCFCAWREIDIVLKYDTISFLSRWLRRKNDTTARIESEKTEENISDVMQVDESFLQVVSVRNSR